MLLLTRRKVQVHLVSATIRRTPCAVGVVVHLTTSKRRHVRPVVTQPRESGATIGPPKLKEGGQRALVDVDT